MSALPAIETESERRRFLAASSLSAFSLIEVLVATTILALIVTMLGSIMSFASTLWTSSSGRSETGLSARAIADYIQTDLAPALLPVNNADASSLQFVLNSSQVPSKYKNGDALFWQAPVANDTTYGDIAEVGYFVKWITDANAQPKPILCRFFVEPSASGDASSAYQIYQSPGDWLNQAQLDAVAPGTADKNYAGLFAENVVAIWFRCFDSQGNTYGKTFDSRTAPEGGTKSRLPCSVQVSFVVLDSRSAARLNATLQQELVSLTNNVSDDMAASAKSKTVSPAEEFVTRATSNPALKSLLEGLKAHTTTVSLVNAR